MWNEYDKCFTIIIKENKMMQRDKESIIGISIIVFAIGILFAVIYYILAGPTWGHLRFLSIWIPYGLAIAIAYNTYIKKQ